MMNLMLLFIFLSLIFGFTFNPMSQSIDLEENQTSAQFLLENETSEKMAVELSVVERIMDKNGIEKLPETKELSVFPPQLIIPAKDKRTIRVIWNGAKTLSSEKAFRVIAEQLPMKIDRKKKNKSGIQMLMKYMAALYITPPSASSKLIIKEIKSENNKVLFTIKNEGNKHQVLINPTITFSEQGKKHVLKSDELNGVSGENVLANSERSFSISKSLPLTEKAEAIIKVNE